VLHVSGGKICPISGKASDSPFPKVYLLISVLTLLSTLVGTSISLLNVAPAQEKLKNETKKIRQEMDQANRRSKEEQPRIAASYLIIDSNNRLERAPATKLNPAAGPDLGSLPRLRLPDFSSTRPTFKQWTGLAKPDACDCRYFYNWLSKHAKDKDLGPTTEKTLYLILQRMGSVQADDMILTADRVKLETTTSVPPFEGTDFSRDSYGPVNKVDLELGSLEPGHGLLVPVATRVDFAAEDLESDFEVGGPRPDGFYYGVTYIPKELSYFDPLKEERVRLPIRRPIDSILELGGGSIAYAG
jgi:hypothetical protein